jgi:hypothetical protein
MTKTEHLELLVEEPSMEVFLTALLPRVLNGSVTFAIHTHQGKQDLQKKLSAKLRAYAKWLPKNTRIIVIIDRDNEDCKKLKHFMDDIAESAGFHVHKSSTKNNWRVVNRIAIEELEAWFFGEWAAVKKAYPKVSFNIPNHTSYRQPDAIVGGTWEAFERILKKAGYFESGLRKIEAAQAIGKFIDPNKNISPSFNAFFEIIQEVIAL